MDSTNDYVGDTMEISTTFYDQNGNQMNEGKKVQKTIDDIGSIMVNTANPLTDTPYKVQVNIYANGELVCSHLIILTDQTGTQTVLY